MQDVLQEIDDGVIILEEKPDEDIAKEESFVNVEFANSFMQKIFGTTFKSDSPESAKRIQELSKELIKSKTSEQLMGKQDNNSAENLEPTTSLQKLISSAEDNSPNVSKDIFLVINAPRKEEDNTNESTRALRREESSELDRDAYVVQASVRKLVFNDKECCILILKNMTSAFRFKKASEMEQKLQMLTTTVSHEMRLPLQSVISMCRVMLAHTTNKIFIELIKTIESAVKILLCRVNDLLDSSTMKNGTFTKKMKLFDIVEAVEEVVQINSQQALYRDVSMIVKQINRVPKHIFTDETRLQ